MTSTSGATRLRPQLPRVAQWAVLVASCTVAAVATCAVVALLTGRHPSDSWPLLAAAGAFVGALFAVPAAVVGASVAVALHRRVRSVGVTTLGYGLAALVTTVAANIAVTQSRPDVTTALGLAALVAAQAATAWVLVRRT